MRHNFDELVADLPGEQSPDTEHAGSPSSASGDATTTNNSDATHNQPANSPGEHEPANGGATNERAGGEPGPTPAPSTHSIAGKMARAVALAAAGKTEEAQRIVASMERQEARAAMRRSGGPPRQKFHFLVPAWRAQWAGQDIGEICQTLGKTVHKKDTSGATGREFWRSRVGEILASEPDTAKATDKIADAIEAKLAERNAAARTTLANGLVEIQVQVAELLKLDPRAWVRPIRVHESIDDNADTNAAGADAGHHVDPDSADPATTEATV